VPGAGLAAADGAVVADATGDDATAGLAEAAGAFCVPDVLLSWQAVNMKVLIISVALMVIPVKRFIAVKTNKQ
jgi:hypothetical protein